MSFLGGSGASPFGTSTIGGIFGGGQTSTPQQQQGTTAPTTNFFGAAMGGATTATPSVFGGTTTGQQSGFNFGGGATGGGFGTGLFGTTNTAAPTTGLFGTTTTTPQATPGFGQTNPQAAGSSIPFRALQDTDVLMKNGVSTQINVKYQTISMMKEYQNPEKSFEELRCEDYQLNRQRKNATTGTGLFGSSTTSTAPSGGFFSSGAFGTSTTTAGATPAFGTTTTTSAFGATPTLFGQQPSTATTANPFGGGTGLFQQKPASGFFSNTTASGFGTNNATNTFGFGAGASTATSTAAVAPTTTNVFGQPAQQTATTGFNFGQAQSTPAAAQSTGTPAFGSGSVFGTQTQQQQQPLFGGFGQQAGTGTTTGTTSNFFGASTNSTPAKPLFGTGTGTIFGSSNATTATPFGTPATTTTTAPSVFGTTTGATSGGTATISLFGNAAQQQPQQQSKLFGFSTATSTSPFTFGTAANQPKTTAVSTTPTFGGFLTGPGNTTSVFGGPTAFVTPQQTQQLAPFSATTSALRPNYPLGNFHFGPPGTTAVPQPYAPIFPGFVPVHFVPGPISFPTTPYKDSPLFYNLPGNYEIPKSRRVLQRDQQTSMTPTPDADVSRGPLPVTRRKAPLGASPTCPLNVSNCPAVKKLTFTNKGESSVSKYKIFDGFEEEDFGVGINILQRKTDVKKLDLRNLKIPLEEVDQNQTPQPKGMARVSQEILKRKEKALTLEQSGANSPELSPLLQNARRVRFQLPGNEDNSQGSPVSEPFKGIEEFVRRLPEAGDAPTFLGETVMDKVQYERQTGEKGILPGEKCGVVNTRADYWTEPSLEELDLKVDSDGNCVVIGLKIGRKHYGCIKFLSPVNVAGQNLDKLVQFRHKEVIVYPNDNEKPPMGQGLNAPAEIELERVWPVDKETNELIRDPDHAKLQSYPKKLKSACRRMGAEFVSYNEQEGLWVFRVGHF